jgi:sporulation protein YtfJ
MDNKKSITELMGATMAGLRDMVNVNTIVGEPITTADGATIIPVTRLSMGFGAGGSEFGDKSANAEGNMGGGGAGGVKVTPVAFLVIADQSVRLLPVTGQSETTLDKLVDLVPKLVKQAEGFLEKRKKKEEEAEED